MTALAYWNMGSLWSVLADGAATDGSYSLLEQLMPPEPQAPPHVHEGMDEAFYMLDGEAEFLLDSRTEVARKGALVFDPARHGARLPRDESHARALNLYTPAGFERTVIALAPRADARTLLPPGWAPYPTTAAPRCSRTSTCGG